MFPVVFSSVLPDVSRLVLPVVLWVASPLTAKELGLLTLLWERRGSAVSRGEILESVWDLRADTKTRVVDTFVSRLRKLFEDDPSEPQYLLSVRSFGYRLVDSPE